jgi:hypothetical protein
MWPKTITLSHAVLQIYIRLDPNHFAESGSKISIADPDLTFNYVNFSCIIIERDSLQILPQTVRKYDASTITSDGPVRHNQFLNFRQ